MILYLIAAIAVVAGDLLVKLWAADYLQSVGSIKLIDKVFNLTYAENTGAAFSILEGKIWFFIILTAIMLAVIAYIFFAGYFKGVWGKLSLVFIFAGALGNFISRIVCGYVIDMFDFCLINFPVFNVADIFITAGGIMAVIYLVFIDKELLSRKKRSEDEHKSN